MTDHSQSSAARPVPSTAPDRRPAGRRAPATAAGVLTALALGAGVLLLPTGAPDATDDLVTATARQVAHPAPPETASQTQAEAPAPPPAAPRVRDPFEPLVRDAAPATSAPVQSPTVTAPAGGTTTVVDEVTPPQAPQVSFPTVPADGAAGSEQRRELALVSVETSGDRFVAVLTLDGERLRAEVGDSFGPRADLLLLSLQEGPAAGQWTAVVQVGQGEPFDLVTGTSTRLP